jgi:hypothetical protein
MPDFQDLKKKDGNVKTFMSLLAKVSRPGCGDVVLNLALADPEPGSDDDEDEEKEDPQEVEVRCTLPRSLQVADLGLTGAATQVPLPLR